MANTKTAKKRARKIVRQTAANRDRMSRIRTFLRKVEDAIAGGDKAAAQAALGAAEPEFMRGAQRGVIHRNTAARKLSRLSARVKAL